MSEKKKIIIRDAVDIDLNITDSSIQENKTSLTDSEEVRYSEIDLRHSDLKIFSLLTTSDKEINVRTYPDEHVQNMIKDHSWTVPYAKPLQTNHDVYGDCNARFLDAWYLDHKTLTPKYGFTEIPQKVIDEFKKRGAFKEGTGSAIGMAETANKDFKIKIINGTYLTTSQGAATESLTCNICNNSYRDFHKCTHSRGSTYPIYSDDGKHIIAMRKCVPFTGPLTAVEDSVVNVPANDTSTLLVFDMKKDQLVTMDNISEYSDIFNVKDIKNNFTSTSDNKNTETNELNDGKQPGLSQEEIQKIKDLLDKGMPIPTDALNNKANDENKDSKLNDEKENLKLNDNKNKTGGVTMSNKIKNATAKRIFRSDMKSFNVTNDEKINEYFEELTDDQLDVINSLLDFISVNKEVVQDKKEPETPITDNKDKEPEKELTDEEKDKLQKTEDELQEALKIICDLKGINNKVPTLADLQNVLKDEKDKKEKAKKSGITDFGF